MRDRDDRRRDERDDLPGPAEESDTGSIGNTDERSSENRREGLEKDRERAKHPDEVVDPDKKER